MKTLNDFQKLLGDINWIRPFLKLSTSDLKPLFDILRGDPNPTSPRTITEEGQKALQKVEDAINKQQLYRLDYTLPWYLIVLKTNYTPTGYLWQSEPLEWLHLPVSYKSVISSYPSLVANTFIKGRHRSKELFGKEMQFVITLYNKDQVQVLFQSNDNWQIAFQRFTGQILYHLPDNPLLKFIDQHPIIFPHNTSLTPLPPPAVLGFTDGSSNEKAITIIDNEPIIQETLETSAQHTEIIAVITAFQKLLNVSFNRYTDSLYIVKLFPGIEMAPISCANSTIDLKLQQLQYLIQKRTCPFYIGHVRSHSKLPGNIHEGNRLAEKLTKVIAISMVE